MTSYLGVGLAASAARPAAYALLAEDRTVLELGDFGPDEELLRLAVEHRPAVIAIDAPLGLPAGWECLDDPCSCGQCEDPEADRRRAAERQLIARKIPFYWTTRRSIIRAMVYRGMELRYALERRGFLVLEVYPYATKVRLWGRRIPKKSSPEGQRFLQQRLRQMLPSLRQGPRRHDPADAPPGGLHRVAPRPRAYGDPGPPGGRPGRYPPAGSLRSFPRIARRPYALEGLPFDDSPAKSSQNLACSGPLGPLAVGVHGLRHGRSRRQPCCICRRSFSHRRNRHARRHTYHHAPGPLDTESPHAYRPQRDRRRSAGGEDLRRGRVCRWRHHRRPGGVRPRCR